MPLPPCPLCHPTAERILWKNADFRLIAVPEDLAPGYVRLIAHDHVRETSALSAPSQAMMWSLLVRTERLMLSILRPEKINLASLGNQVPHLHWHIIPRWSDDPWFPDSIWSAPHRQTSEEVRQKRLLLAEDFFSELARQAI